jgi:hypothetical protein
LGTVKSFDGACFLSRQMTMVYQPKLGDMVAGNAQFQTIVKSFGLEHLARAAPGDDGDEYGRSLVRLLQTALPKKRPFF